MTTSSNNQEFVWDGILSQDRQRIVKTFLLLDEPSRKIVIDHLQCMTRESGWHPDQVRSAQAALDALTKKET